MRQNGEQMREKDLDSGLVPHLNFIYFIPTRAQHAAISFIYMRKAHTQSHKKKMAMRIDKLANGL